MLDGQVFRLHKVSFWHSPKILRYSFDNKFIGFILACIHVHIFQFISLALKIIDSG